MRKPRHHHDMKHFEVPGIPTCQPLFATMVSWEGRVDLSYKNHLTCMKRCKYWDIMIYLPYHLVYQLVPGFSSINQPPPQVFHSPRNVSCPQRGSTLLMASVHLLQDDSKSSKVQPQWAVPMASLMQKTRWFTVNNEG